MFLGRSQDIVLRMEIWKILPKTYWKPHEIPFVLWRVSRLTPTFSKYLGLSCLQCNAVSSGMHVFKNVAHIIFSVMTEKKDWWKELHSGLCARGIASRVFGSQPRVWIISTFFKIVFPFSIHISCTCLPPAPPPSIDNLLKTWLNDNNYLDNLNTLF